MGEGFGIFGSLVFAIAPLYATSIRQEDGMSCNPECFSMLHCALWRGAINGSIQLPHDRFWLFCVMALIAFHCNVSKCASFIQTKLVHLHVAWLYPTPYLCNPLCVPQMFFCLLCPPCFWFVSIGGMCRIAPMCSANSYSGLHWHWQWVNHL